MTRIGKSMLGLAFAFAFAGGAQGRDDGQSPEPGGKQPFEIIRSMQAIQDQIVLGSAEAHAKLPKLIGRIAERLLGADPAVWRDAKNARAAVVYVLSGGQPRVVRKILELGASPEQEAILMEGALAYVEGREAKARQILSPVDAKGLASPIGGHIAMVQSALIAKEDPAKAIQLLDQARILAPGTLVEEAALRREVFLCDETKDFERFAALSSQYIRRFPKSVYADNFRRRFSDFITHFAATSEAAQFAGLEKLLSELDPEERLRLYLKIAQSGLVNGKIGAARLAAERAAGLSKEGSVEAARSTLYGAAALVLTNSLERGVGQLESLDAARLARRDAELKEAIIAIANQIRKDPDDKRSSLGAEPIRDATALRSESGVVASASALIESTESALGRTEAILKGSAP